MVNTERANQGELFKKVDLIVEKCSVVSFGAVPPMVLQVSERLKKFRPIVESSDDAVGP